MKSLPLLLLTALLFIASSCDKLKKDPEVKLSFTEINSDGVLMTATVTSGKKNIDMVGFCYGKNSKPVAEPNYSSGFTTTISSFTDDNFTSVIPDFHFESYTGYYIRPFIKTTSGKFIYAQEVYYENIQKPAAVPTCSPADNYVDMGLTYPPPHLFSEVEVIQNTYDSYHVQASTYSNLDRLDFEFYGKPKTGVYTTSPYETEDRSKVYVLLHTGSVSKILDAGYPVYINEVAKGKFEITLCDIPWQFSGSTTLHVTSKIILQE